MKHETLKVVFELLLDILTLMFWPYNPFHKISLMKVNVSFLSISNLFSSGYETKVRFVLLERNLDIVIETLLQFFHLSPRFLDISVCLICK